MADKKTVVMETPENEPVSCRTRSHQRKKEENVCRLSDHREDLTQGTKGTDDNADNNGKSYDKNMHESLLENGPAEGSNASSMIVTEGNSDKKTKNVKASEEIKDRKDEANVEITENITHFSEDECNTNVRKRNEISEEVLSYKSKIERNEKTKFKSVDHIDRNVKHTKYYSKFSWTLLFAAVTILALTLCFWNMRSEKSDVLKKSQTELSNTKYQSFHDTFELIKIKYPRQTARFWRIIGSQVKRLLTENTEAYPAVVIIAIPQGQSKVGTCLATDVISSMNNLYQETSSNALIDLKTLNGESAVKRKESLDEKLQAALKTDKGVILDHLEALHADVALLLHGYCDGDNAPFKSSSAIFLELHTNRNSSRLNDAGVIDILTELWQAGLGKDEFPALMSRIANSIAVVENEDNFKCDVTKM